MRKDDGFRVRAADPADGWARVIGVAMGNAESGERIWVVQMGGGPEIQFTAGERIAIGEFVSLIEESWFRRWWRGWWR